MLPIEARTPSRIESAPSEGPTVRSSRYLIEAGNAPAFKHQRQILRGFLGEIAGDFAAIFDAAVDHGRGVNLIVEHDGHAVADVRFGEGAEAGRGSGRKRELHVILAGIGGAGLRGRAAQVLAGDDGSAIQNVIDLLRSLPGSGAFRLAGNDFCAGRQNATVRCQRGRLRRIRGCSSATSLSCKLAAGLNHGLGAGGIAFAGKLDENFIVAAAGESDGRLGKAESVDAAGDGFERLIHGLGAKVRTTEGFMVSR